MLRAIVTPFKKQPLTTPRSKNSSNNKSRRVAGLASEQRQSHVKLQSGAIPLSQHAAKIGADATLQVTPYYNKPTAEGLYRHFSIVAEKSGLPIVLYNVPGRTGREIPVDVVARLSKHQLVIATKEAGGSVDRVNAILDACDITVLSGDDSLTLPMISVGAKGVISVASNIIPKQVSQMVEHALNGNFSQAYQIHKKYYPLFRDLFIESNPIPSRLMADMKLSVKNTIMCEMQPDTGKNSGHWRNSGWSNSVEPPTPQGVTTCVNSIRLRTKHDSILQT